jgi:hypothetical protein
LLTRVGIDCYPLHSKYCPFLLSEWISATSSLEKKCRGGMDTETTMSADEGPSSRRPRTPRIEENQNAKQCHNWIRARAGEMAAKGETTMSAGEGPSGGGVNPMPEEGPRLDPLGFRRGAKQRQGGACQRGGREVGEWPTSRLRAQVSGNYKEVSMERRRRCRGPHL